MEPAIPSAQITEFHGRAQPVALIVGVYDEGGKFTHQLTALQPYRQYVDILVADGGSRDGATAPAALKDKARALLVNTGPQRGLSVQYRAAIAYALAQGYESVIMMDGNGKDGVDAIPRFLDKLKEGYDFVQGSRFLPGGHHERTPLDRVLGIRCVFNPLMYLGSGFYYSDAMNGFKACSRAFLTDPHLQPLRPVFVRYGLQYYLNYMAPRLGVRIAEIPVARVYPAGSGSYSKIGGIAGRLKIMAELLSTVTGRYNP